MVNNLENALKKYSEELLDAILENAIESIVVLDSEMRYVLWNKAVEKDTGIPPEEVLGKKITDAFPEMENSKFLETYKRVSESKKPETIEDWFINPGQAPKYYCDRVFPFKDGVIMFARDITKEKEKEKK